MTILKPALAVLTVLTAQVRADGSSDDIVPSWVEDGGWIILVLACLAMFYGLAAVVEEFFVPALNTVSQLSLCPRIHHFYLNMLPPSADCNT